MSKVRRLLALACLITAVNTARILGIFPIMIRSHFSCNHAILKSLHTVGHNVTMITPFPSEKKIENFTYIIPPTSSHSFVGHTTLEEWDNMTANYLLHWGTHLGAEYCDNMLKMPEIQKALHSSDKLYDVLLAEYLNDFDCYLAIAAKLNIPIIATITLRLRKTVDNAIGVPNNPAVIPAVIGSSNVEMSMVERMENLFRYVIFDYCASYTRWHIREVYQKYLNFIEEFPAHRKHVSLVFYNNHASLLPRSYVANAIDVGGIHVTPAQLLPQNIQKFIDEASHGVILFALGSVFRGSSMPIKQRMAFLNAFASIPQRVIWKYEEPIENLPENIMISSWLPQRDILEHKNVIAFISHCGLNGILEAVMTGTPVVAIPIFADQLPNAAILRFRGIGVHLNFRTATEESVLNALNAIINDTSYYQRMQEFSRVFKDRPMTPQESVVYWTEYIIRHDGASHLRAIGTDMPFYKYLMLDVIALVLLSISLVIFAIYVTVRKIYKLLIWRSKYVSSVKKND